MMPLMIANPVAGTVLGDYLLLEKIGEGGFAEVFRAERIGPAASSEARAPGRIVAVKVAKAGGEAEVRRGARTQEALLHPGIVRVREAVLDAEPPYVALELVAGGNLRQALEERTRIAPAEALRVVARVLEILEFAHASGVVHGDLKPENILLAEHGWPLERRVRLTDFGLRRKVGGPRAASRPLEGSLSTALGAAGTPIYLAPEIAAGEPGDARVDVYAAGALLFELVTGRRPWGSDLPSELVPTAPAAIDAIVRTAMRGDPERRYASARGMREAIGSVLEDVRREEARLAEAEARRRANIAAVAVRRAAAAAGEEFNRLARTRRPCGCAGGRGRRCSAHAPRLFVAPTWLWVGTGLTIRALVTGGFTMALAVLALAAWAFLIAQSRR